MKKTLRERIIRRLGGTPVYTVGRDPVPGYELIPVRTEICQKPEGVRITVEYIAEPEGQKRRKKA